MIQLIMLSTCSRCGRQEVVTAWMNPGGTLTAMLPTRWRELASGVVCDRCDHGAPANVLPFHPIHKIHENGTFISRPLTWPSAPPAIIGDPTQYPSGQGPTWNYRTTPSTHLCTPRGSIPPELRVA